MAEVFGGSTEAEVGAWRIVGVDSSRPAQVHGTVDVAATAARLDALAVRDGRPTVLAIHHAPTPPSTNAWFQLDGASDLLDELGRRPQVRMVVSGHLHHPFEVERPGGPSLLGCPSTIMAIAHDGDRYEVGAAVPTGARILTLGDDGSWSAELLGRLSTRHLPEDRESGWVAAARSATMAVMENRSRAELDAQLPEIRRSPATDGPIELIVRRPEELGREVLDEGELDLVEGLVGDCWRRARQPAHRRRVGPSRHAAHPGERAGDLGHRRRPRALGARR